MNKSNTALLEAVNAALEELKADGTLHLGPFIQFFNGLVSERVLQYKPEKA